MEDRYQLRGFTQLVILTLYHILDFHLISAENMTTSVSGEYCNRDSFKASCGYNQVINITEALYGRLKLGACITEDPYNSLGCHNNVLSLARSYCSGRRECDVRVIDFETSNPCRQLVNHLHLTYECIDVVVAGAGRCYEGELLKVTTPSSGYIASTISQGDACGDKVINRPWLLEAMRGQQIQITLLDFSTRDETRSREMAGTCIVHAIIEETTSRSTQTVCGGKGKEQVVVYQSQGNAVQIWLQNSGRVFLLYYEFTGCGDILPTPGMSAMRQNDVTTLRCDVDGKTWEMICNGTTWQGQMQNCTQYIRQDVVAPIISRDEHNVASPKNLRSFSWEVVMVMLAIVTGGIVTCVLIVGVVFLKRSQSRNGAIPVSQYPPEHIYELYDVAATWRRNASRPVGIAYPDYTHPGGYNSLPRDYKPSTSSEEDSQDVRYHRPIWERPLPRPPSQELPDVFQP